MGHPAEKRDKYTYKDYLLTPEDERYELIGGDLIMVPAPNTHHQRVSLKIVLALEKFVTENDLGVVFYAPCDVYLDDENVVQPDILFVSKDRQSIITKPNIKGAPDLVVEIVSPSSAYNDLVKKKKLYARFGVEEYWIVDPEEKTAEILHLKGDAFATAETLSESGFLSSDMLQGLKISLAKVFA